MTDQDIHLTFWEHIEAFRRTAIKTLLTIFLGTMLSLLFYPQVFEVLTYPHYNFLSSKSSNSSFIIENIDKNRIKNISTTESVYNLSFPVNNVSLSSERVRRISNIAYLIPSGEYIEYEKIQPTSQLVLLSPTEGLTTILKTSLWVGAITTSPLWLYFILQFIAPALHFCERNVLFPFLAISLLFLSLGFAFAFSITIPIANNYLTGINETLGLNFWSLSQYLDYSILLIFANGLAFEVCVILFFLVHFGWISAEKMKSYRRAIIVAIFIASAILTPPDVLTQLLLAFPLIAIYELAILYAQLIKSKRILKLKTAKKSAN